jgi:hypothetical protein
MITGIILGYILYQIGAPTIIWVAYGAFWVSWLVRVILLGIKAVSEHS